MDFQKFDKIPRLSRDIVITEKIDGTNAQIYICSLAEINNSFAGDYLLETRVNIAQQIIDNVVIKKRNK